MEADFGDEQVKLIVGGISLLLTAAAPTPTYDWKLTPAGWGPVRIGMTREQVARALMAELSGEALDNEGSCIELFPEKEELRGTYFMFQGGKLSRISVVEAGKFATPRRIQVGAGGISDLLAEAGQERCTVRDRFRAQGPDDPCRQRQHPAGRRMCVSRLFTFDSYNFD